MKKHICPSCSHREGVPIFMGFPSEEMLEQAKRGEIVLGGCVLDSMDRECLNCGHRWDSSAPKPDQRPSSATSSPIGDSQGAKADRPSVSVLPTIVLLVVALAVTLAIAGPVLCSDGWASGSIGRRGACSYHGGVNWFPRMLAVYVSLLIAALFHRYRVRRAEERQLSTTPHTTSQKEPPFPGWDKR